MKDYLIRIKKAELVDDKFGKHIKVTMIGLYDENGKWIKWTKINENILEVLLSNDINISIK